MLPGTGEVAGKEWALFGLSLVLDHRGGGAAFLFSWTEGK